MVVKEATANPDNEEVQENKEKLAHLVYLALMVSQVNEDAPVIQDADVHQVTSLWSTVRP